MNRRSVLLAGFAGGLSRAILIAAGVRAQSSPSWPPDARQYRFHMIGNAHIDPVWLWPWQEGLSVVHSTFRSALDRMNETPEFTFTASSAQFYKWVAEIDPQMLAEIRRRVEEGRWDFVGGWWVEPDINIPNGESLVRQGLYGQLTFRRLFGRIAKVGYNPDSFGHVGTLPQILKLQGLDSYVFMRPQRHEKKLPADLFWWESPDGSRVLTFRIPISYNDDERVEARLINIIRNFPEPTKTLMGFYGVGDHGGGPTKVNIQSILDIQKQPDGPKVFFSTPDRYFSEVRSTPDLPVVHDDLQHHAVGCYTAVSEIKKNNRLSEAFLVTGEKLAALASALAGFDYPRADFVAAWEKVLFLQFHDSMGGTSLPEHYAAARDAHGYALEVARQAMARAAQKIAWQVPAEDPKSDYLVVFNPHAWSATLDVEYDLDWKLPQPAAPGALAMNSRLEDEQGAAIAHQWTQGTTVIGNRNALVFRAPVPAFGYRQFRLRPLPAVEPQKSAVRATDRGLENEHLRVTVAADGSLSIFDKDAGRQLFKASAGGCRAVVLDDPSDTWSHDVRAYTKEIGAFGDARFRVMEDGPLRARLRVRTQYGASALEVDWILYAGCRRLEARVTLDWHESLKMLKFSFPVEVDQPRATYEVAYGHQVRKTEGDEDPGQRWVDVSGRRGDNEYGLAVINDAKYGYSVEGSDLRVSIARGAPFAHHFPRKLDPHAEYLWQDQGIQTLRMLLVPHSGSWQEAGVVRWAEEFVTPVSVVYQGIHPGTRPLAASFLSVDVPNIVVAVVKQAEEGDDFIVRCYETAGRETTASIDLGLVKQHWRGHFRPSEIKTLRVPAAGGEIREVDVLE
jgi:alpha-mannosidase